MLDYHWIDLSRLILGRRIVRNEVGVLRLGIVRNEVGVPSGIARH